MAVRINVQKIDDLDGTCSEDVSTVHFGLDGVRYEIDLNPANATALRGVLAEFIEAAQRIGTTAGSLAYVDRRELASLIRAWAVENGFSVCRQGRIPIATVLAYKLAHDDVPGNLPQQCEQLLAEQNPAE